MRIYDVAFWGIAFFLLGVLIASLINDWQEKILVAVLAALLAAVALLIFNKKWHAVLSLFIFIGAGYYFIFDADQKEISIPFGQKTDFSGLITDVSIGLNKQELVLKLSEPHRGNIKLVTGKYPSWNHGDLVEAEGVIKRPSERSKRFFEKEGIFGISNFPKLTLKEKNQGSPVKSALFKIKSFAENSFREALPPEKASFMAGLTLGETGEFPSEFKGKMNLTGTTHLVALSGYNIAIIAKSIVLVLGLWLSRRKTFFMSILAILSFVIMTGAEASVVRAAIMALVVLLASQVQRAYSFRNSIAIAAFIMILFNPKILVWDIGFQLSFFAVMGLIYLKPAVERFFRMKPSTSSGQAASPGFLNWRENLTTTASAQVAVLPILLSNFGLFSPVSFLTNVLILTFIPVTMFIGFVIVLSGILSQYLALVLGWLANVFLSYEIGVIDIFSRINIQISVEQFSLALSVLYYLALVWFIRYSNKKAAIFTH